MVHFSRFFFFKEALPFFEIFVYIFRKVSNLLFSMFSQVIEEPYLRVLYTTDERYNVKRSFYSNKISTSNSALHASQYLSITVDAEEKRQVEQQMKVRTSY